MQCKGYHLSLLCDKISVFYAQKYPKFITHTAKNTVILPNFLVWKFCGKAQFLHSFGRNFDILRRITQRYRATSKMFDRILDALLVWCVKITVRHLRALQYWKLTKKYHRCYYEIRCIFEKTKICNNREISIIFGKKDAS